jgi:ABC-type transport system involved in multi-copper enzyme maturation permease subunit
MSFLPVVERELRVTARNSRLYWGRMAAAAIAVAIIAWFWLATAGAGSTSAQRAKVIFSTLSMFSFCYCLVLGLFLTADCISEEKREGTLGLLFLTNLKSYDVALGKLGANSFRALYSLIAIFPVLTIPLLLGGLVGQEIFRMALVLVVTLIFSLTLGLFLSSISKHDRKAQFGALALMLFLTAIVPGLLSFLRHEYRMPIDETFCAISPGLAFGYAFENQYQGNPHIFWTSLTVVHAVSWLAFFGATWMVRRVWQDRAAGAAAVGWRGKFQLWKRGAPSMRKLYREKLLGVNPYYWLTARDRFKPYYVLWFLCGCAAFWVFLWSYNGRDMLEQEVFFACALVLHTAMKVWVAAEAGRQLSEDRKSSALELTLSTPIQIKDILEGQFLGLLRQFGLPIAAILIFDVIGMILGARMRMGADTDAVLMWVAMMIIFVVDAVTIATFGMWLGLTAKRSSRAIVQTLFYVLCLPWLILFGMLTYMMLVRFSGLESMAFFVGAYFVVSLAVDFVLFLRASGNLTSRFREVATQRFDSSRS